MMTPVKPGSAAAIAAGSGRSFGLRDGAALGVVGVGLDAPLDRETVGLHAVLHDRHGLGRLAEGDRQHAGGERVERAGVARLLGVEQVLEPPDRLRRGDADGLVEIDPAVDLGALGAALRRAAARRRRRGLGLIHGLPRLRRVEIARDARRAQQRVHPRLGVEAFVDDEAQVGRVFEIDALRDRRPQSLLVRLQRRERRRRCRAPPSGRKATVASFRSGDMRTPPMVTTWRFSTGSSTSPRDEDVAEGMADLLADALQAMRRRAGFGGDAGHGGRLSEDGVVNQTLNKWESATACATRRRLRAAAASRRAPRACGGFPRRCSTR